MQRSNFYKILLIGVVIFMSFGHVKAQDVDALSTYTPYSLYGIGDIAKQGTAFNKGMGGIGVGVRDRRFINYLNPAAITSTDTLSFMFDFGVNQKNIYSKGNTGTSAYNTLNLQNIMFTAPIYKKSALIVGIVPYSNIGYKFNASETDNKIIANYGDISYQKYGQGSINKFFIGGAMNFAKNFSFGAEFIYYFGALDRYSNVLFETDLSARDINTGWNYKLNALSGRFGLQYFKEMGDKYLTVGATYSLKSDLKGDYTRYVHAVSNNSKIDTVQNSVVNNYKTTIPAEIAAGFSYGKKDKWLVGFDYSRQDWEKINIGNIDGVDFKPSVASSFKLGFEYIPNKYDIRYYFKRVTYKGGAYYDKSYINVNGNQIDAYGITFGMSLPIYMYYNSINWSVDIGQRGTLKNDLVRETYIQFNVNISLHDIWFRKKRYQ
jgi:Outer membrane protein transport protein (OMPP1/FadL/TodX).